MSVQEDRLQAIADAIRAKLGTSEKIPATSFPEYIAKIKTGTDTSDATATAGDILSGRTAYARGSKLTGTLVPSSGKDTSDATATAKDILYGKTAYARGAKLTGDMGSMQAKTITPGTSDQIIYSGLYLAGNITVKGDSDLKGVNIRKGTEIFGVTGTLDPTADMSDATAAAADIRYGKTAYVSGGKTVGSMGEIAAQTVTPGKDAQTVAGGAYLAGNITIAGDDDLIPGNIREGVEIFGVTGTLIEKPERNTLAIPVQSGSLTYSGVELYPAWDGYGSAYITIGGTTSATNAGTYTATFTPRSGYQWSDGTTGTKSVSWTIGKATPRAPILSAYSLSLDDGSKSFTVLRDGDGEIRAASTDESVCETSVSGDTVNVLQGASGGVASIRVTVGEGANYFAYDGYAAVCTVSYIPDDLTLDTASWALISRLSKAGRASEYFAVGDTKQITFNGTAYEVQIIGFDHDNVTDAESYGRAKAGITFQFGILNSTTKAGVYSQAEKMNATDTNAGSWASSLMRTTTIPQYKGYLPADLQNVLVAVDKLTKAGGNSSTLGTSSDELFLFAGYEVAGSSARGASAPGEGTQYELFKSASDSGYLRNVTGSTSSYWWLRSPLIGNSMEFVAINTMGNVYSLPASVTTPAARVSFGFCV